VLRKIKKDNMSTSFIGQLDLPMGLRNNNPLNIRPFTNGKWKGELTPINNYCVFEDVEHGVRAGGKDLTTKLTIDGLNTLDKYIPKFAPPSDDNYTQNYINTVSQLTGFSP